ncbi:transposase, partial [Yersinia pestis]|nr:transposase [Yersinia pestis]MDL1687799.1 transposase [Yersinia pestis]
MVVWWFGGLVVWWFESVIGFGCYGFTAHLASDEPTAKGAISALNPRSWIFLSMIWRFGSMKHP